MRGVSVNVDMSPVLAYIASAEKSVPAVYEAAARAVAETTREVETTARELAPELTGDLKRSIQSEADGLIGRVFTDLRYAPFVEFGTYKDRPQPFLLPAADQQERKYPATLERMVLPVVLEYLG